MMSHFWSGTVGSVRNLGPPLRRTDAGGGRGTNLCLGVVAALNGRPSGVMVVSALE